MSIQLINFVFLVATINGVYSVVNITLDKLPSFNDDALKHDYPITEAILEYRIGVVSDLEKASKVPGVENTWYTYFKRGYLTYDPNNLEVSVRWDNGEGKGDMYYSETSNKQGRGFELSEMVYFDGNLIVADDQTGTLYTYLKGDFVPWTAVSIGDKGKDDDTGEERNIQITGHVNREQRAMAIEWATVRDDYLYVGPNFQVGKKNVARITRGGIIDFADWSKTYDNLRAKLKIPAAGEIVIEACVYSKESKLFYVVPKLVSNAPKPNEITDNKWIIPLRVPDNFGEEVTVENPIAINEVKKNIHRGISSAKFIPNTKDSLIVAIETSELYNASYITVFTKEGKMILNSTKVADVKFEGLDFL